MLGGAGVLQDLSVLADEKMRFSAPGRADKDGDMSGHCL
jgi:hypothetical protein